MKFPYAKINGKFQPIIPIDLRANELEVRTVALVDSGADASLFHADFAAELGIESIEEGEYMEFNGISGAPLRAYHHEIRLVVGGHEFADFGIAFSNDISPDSFNILGQADFFALFPVKFTYRKREINLMSSSKDAA